MSVRVLIVDDDADIRLLLSMTLPLSGMFEVVDEAVDGEEAVAKAAAHRPDLILMDVMMPGLGGIEATRQIKEQHPHMIVVGFTASGEEGAAGMMNAGATAVVDKASVGRLTDLLEQLKT